MSLLPRLFGVLTTAFGVSLIARPALMVKPAGLTDADGGVPDGVALMSRALGARDVVSGLAMTFAPSGPALRAAIAVRVASDVADAVFLGLLLPDKQARPKMIAIAGVWASLCAASALTVRSHS